MKRISAVEEETSGLECNAYWALWKKIMQRVLALWRRMLRGMQCLLGIVVMTLMEKSFALLC
mgnify:CR=1 FL=1